MDDELQELLVQFYWRAEKSLGAPAWLTFERDVGLDRATLAANAGMLAVLPIGLRADRSFFFADSGPLGVVFECLAADAETIVDLVAYPLRRPDAFATALHRADAIGVTQISNPATFALGNALRVHRTPQGWLQSGCVGCVPLNATSAPAWLGCAPGRILGEDAEHGREISKMVGRTIPPSRILAPIRRRAA